MVMQSMQNVRYVSTFQRLTGKYHKFVAICTDCYECVAQVTNAGKMSDNFSSMAWCYDDSDTNLQFCCLFRRGTGDLQYLIRIV